MHDYPTRADEMFRFDRGCSYLGRYMKGPDALRRGNVGLILLEMFRILLVDAEFSLKCQQDFCGG